MAEPALLREYVSHLAARAAQGQLAACADPALKARARRLLGPGRRGALDVRGVAERCRRARGGRALRDLLKALELLELLCVNLLLCPWRREIRSLKTFTGNFVYYIQPVLPEDIVKAVLEKIGYVATTATEFSLVKKRNNEETKQTAFEIFLARIECETILEMTNEEKHGNLERSLQKGTQTHQHGGEKDEGDQTPQRGDTESLGREGTSETPLCLAPQQKGSAAPCEAAGNVRVRGDGAQSAPAASPGSPQERQGHGSSTTQLRGKGSDEDFLIKYSDIVIGQTPICSESLSPQALEKEPRARLGGDCALPGAAEAAARVPGPLSPGASGPPAFALFADSPCDSKITLEFEAPGVPEGSIEAEINDAINCIDPAPGDEPTELKSLPYKDFASAQNCSIPREEDVCGLSLTFTELQIKDAQEELTYPVEETGQPLAMGYAGTSDRHVGEFHRSQIKHTYLTDAELHRTAASHTEPPSALCCSAGHTEDSTAGSDSKRLFMDPAKAHPASECFKHVREPPNLTYIPPRALMCGPHTAGAAWGSLQLTLLEVGKGDWRAVIPKRLTPRSLMSSLTEPSRQCCAITPESDCFISDTWGVVLSPVALILMSGT